MNPYSIKRSSKSYAHLYQTRAWRRLRAQQLESEPLCAFCLQLDHITVATVADHIKPHKGDVYAFHDPDNLQSLCKSCHDSAKKRMENKGLTVPPGCDIDGMPFGDW